MRDKVLLPLKNEILKIQVSPELANYTLENKVNDNLLDFKLVFRGLTKKKLLEPSDTLRH